ncbi:acyl-CoA synthetase [Sphingosinithalassobacter portus]|uniref:acyl-CoA synthetase n=1 Tax=Stakelama portus TaxID=2676234 RepID=UPI000D6E8D40|nr:long-chain fatty acid--CoA ligase [Sphingosinithalassobacter portus]
MTYGTQSLHRLIQRAPSEIGAIDGDWRRDWQAIEQDVRRFAGALLRSGVSPGDRVAFLSRNSGRYLDYVLGCFWAGAVINPVNTRWTASEIAYSLENCQTRTLIVSQDFAELVPAIAAEAPGLRDIIVDAADVPDGARSYAQWIADAPLPEDRRVGGDALAAILYTGGTTGRPKGVMLSHGNLLASANGYLAFPGARPGRSYLHVAPLFHIGCLSGMFTSLLAGAAQVFLPMFAPDAVIDVVERESVSDLFLVPTMLRAVLLDPAFAPRRMATVERIVYGASPIDDTLLDRAMDALPGVSFIQAYGMTEVSPIATLLGPEDHSGEARRAGRGRSAGRATSSTEVRIVDSEDREVPRGTPGEIVVRGGGVMQGYWGMPEETAQALANGWMHTGDMGRMDAQGYVTVVDRLKDMIVTGGENVYSAEVENALSAHPDVQQVAVIGVPHPEWGEAVHAAVILKAGAVADADALRAFCRERIAAYKTPKTIAFVEALPLSPAGKVLKTELRAAYS